LTKILTSILARLFWDRQNILEKKASYVSFT
jgi:hypothetical protein